MSPAAADSTGITRWQTPALVVGVVGAVLSAIGAFMKPEDFFRAYLTSWLFWFSIAGGSVGVLCLQYITGGEWGLMIRRPLGAASRSVWMLAVLVIPLVFGMAKVFPWADPSWPKFHEIQQQKGFYLNPTAFWVRNAIYFAFFFDLGVAHPRPLARVLQGPLAVHGALPPQVGGLGARADRPGHDLLLHRLADVD